jgi:hypothetical protein
MGVAALIAWLLTATGGFVMLGMWVSGGGPRAGAATRLHPGLVVTHLAVAVIGLVLWIAYLAIGGRTLAWIAVALLVPVAVVGFTMFARWLPTRRSGTAPESRFPLPVVLGHGLLAVATVVLALLTALSATG